MYECLARPYDIKKTSMNKWKKKAFPFWNPAEATETVPAKRTASEAEANEAAADIDANGDPVEEAEQKIDIHEQVITTEDPELEMVVVARPTPTIRGHTSYLTFAKFIPRNTRN